jgi:hypothetical protein
MGADGQWRLAYGDTSAGLASRLVREVLAACNADRSGNLWRSVCEQLPLLAEAAPREFLLALELALAGEQPLLARMFEVGDSYRPGVHAPYVYLLWALEGLCRAPQHLSHAVRSLARLMVFEPDDRTDSRPLGSLVRVLQPCFPQTSASLQGRLDAIDALAGVVPDAWWALLVELVQLPHNRLSYPTHEPLFRPSWLVAAEDPPAGEADRGLNAIGDRVLAAVGEVPRRWVDIAPHFNEFPANQLGAFVSALSEADLRSLADDDVVTIWLALDRHVRFLNRYNDGSADGMGLTPGCWTRGYATSGSVADVEPRLFS